MQIDCGKIATQLKQAATAVARPELWQRLHNAGKVALIGNGLRQLDFKVDGRVIKIIQQNPDTNSAAGMLAKRGHEVVQIKDVEANQLIGFVDATEGTYTRYGTRGEVLETSDLDKLMAEAGVKMSGELRNVSQMPTPSTPSSAAAENISASKGAVDTSFLDVA
jgi:hypothetical protein